MWAGGEAPNPNGTNQLSGLTELKAREHEFYDDPIDLATWNEEINIQSEWNSNGRVFLRQVDPLPMTILSVVPAGLFPFSGGQ